MSCGLSAPWVAGQLDYARHRGWPAIFVGFNPATFARNAPVEGLRKGTSLRDVAAAVEETGLLVNPVIGPEAVAGSSRMKGGTATLVLLDAICARAAALAAGVGAPTVSDHIARYEAACAKTYETAESFARVCDAAADALRAGGRLFSVGDGAAGVLGCLDASEMPDTCKGGVLSFSFCRRAAGGGLREPRRRRGDRG